MRSSLALFAHVCLFGATEFGSSDDQKGLAYIAPALAVFLPQTRAAIRAASLTDV